MDSGDGNGGGGGVGVGGQTIAHERKVCALYVLVTKAN